MRLVKLLMVAAIALSPMAPSLALAQGRPGGKIDTQPEMVAILKEVVAWMQPTNALLDESQTVSLFITDGVMKAGEDETKGLEGRAWADSFLGEADSKVAALKAQAAALQPLPADLSRRYSALSPQAARQMQNFAKLPGIARDSVADTEQFLARLRPLIVRAAGGDEEAKFLLYAKTLAGTRLSIRGENAMLDITIAMSSTPDHPQAHVARSNQSSNDAMSIALGVLEAELDPEQAAPDVKAAGKAMKAKIAESRAAAVKIWPAAQRSVATSSEGIPPGPLLTLLKRSAATYEESASVELKILLVLDRVADNLLAPEGPDYESWKMEEIEPLVERRLELHQQRIDLVAQK